MNTYRVWMRDGYAGQYNALSIDEAKAQATANALETTKGVAMTAKEQKLATTVDYVDQLN